MNGMYPFRKRWLLLSVPIVIVVMTFICKTNGKYDKVVENKYEINEEFEFEGAKISVKDASVVPEGYIEKVYGENEVLMSVYNQSYKGEGLVMLTLDIKGINKDIFMDMASSWNIIAGTKGNGVAYISDFANGELTDKKEDKEIVLFFKLYDEWLEACDNQIMLMSELYPVQNNVYINLDEE